MLQLTPRRVLALALAVPLALVPGCSTGDPAPAPTRAPLPDGVALEVSGRPVTVAEVDRLAETLLLLHPVDTLPARRRRALADHVLPLAAAPLRFGAARDDALRRAEACLTEVREGGTPEGAIDWSGAVGDLELEVLDRVLGSSVGAVLGPIETSIGIAAVVRVDAPPPDGSDPRAVFRLTGWRFPYAPQGTDLWDFAGLEVRFADADWRDLVPRNVLARFDAVEPAP
ncbi:MAG: hypothetical protein R3F34_15320 [Planctomycetota bacterium]